MKKTLIMGAALVMAVAMTSCKSGESAYKKAYEKAQAQSAQQAANAQQTVQQTVTPVQQVTPAQKVTPAQTVDPATVSVRTESVKLISGSGLKDYSVVVGSFGSQDNATRLQTTLKGQGYDAQIVQSPSSMYRVVISTFADKASAVASRDKVRSTYADAWLLYNK